MFDGRREEAIFEGTKEKPERNVAVRNISSPPEVSQARRDVMYSPARGECTRKAHQKFPTISHDR